MARAVVMAAPVVMVTAVPAIRMMTIPDRHRDAVGHGGRGTRGDRGETDETGNKKLLHYILRILSRIPIRAWHQFSRCQLTRGKCDCSAKDGMRRALSRGKGGRMPIRVGRERQREQSLPVAQIGKSLGESGESVGVRTRDLLIKSQLLYRLSYALPQCPGQRFAAPAGSARNICRRPIAVNRKIMPFTGVRHISCRSAKR